VGVRHGLLDPSLGWRGWVRRQRRGGWRRGRWDQLHLHRFWRRQRLGMARIEDQRRDQHGVERRSGGEDAWPRPIAPALAHPHRYGRGYSQRLASSEGALSHPLSLVMPHAKRNAVRVGNDAKPASAPLIVLSGPLTCREPGHVTCLFFATRYCCVRRVGLAHDGAVSIAVWAFARRETRPLRVKVRRMGLSDSRSLRR
jgi:hypothetical protein